MSTNPVSGDNSAAALANQVNSVIRDVQGLQTVNVFKDETGTRRVLLGKQGDGSYGLKVSQPTFDVYTAADDDLIFNSSNNVPKIVVSDTATIDATSSTAGSAITETVPHNLGYVPAFWAYFSAGGFYYQIPNATGWGASGGVMTFTNWLFASVDANNIYLTFIPSSTGNLGTFPIKYYLLQESAS